MDQRIFDQLDMLESGARAETLPSRYVYEDSSGEYSAYEGPGGGYFGADECPYDVQYEDDGFVDQPMTMDSLDEQLLRQPDYNNRDAQAALGRERLTVPTGSRPPAYGPRDAFTRDLVLPANAPSFATQGFDLSRYALDQDRPGEFSSSPSHQPLRSSPAFSANQRHPRPYEDPRPRRESNHSSFVPQAHHNSRYEPLGLEQLQAEERRMQAPPQGPIEYFQPSYHRPAQASKLNPSTSATPVVQGISLVSTRTLPDRFRAVFPYPLFNSIQSKSFDTIYNTNDNFVLSAPTGSGKTAVLELAICRLVTGFAAGSYKIVYQAPTKSLCSERQRDWQAKFAPLDLKCAELTGDTEAVQLRNVKHASIIVTTPEKWDSVTRKWKDHQKLMQMVKLFLIDEVHILKEDRGATLEAVVSRMKSVGSNVRFLALSATVPNSDDIATWLGKDPMNAHLSAPRERFGEEFRPVRLQKHVVGYQSNMNDFAFEKTLSTKLPEVITKWSQRKPIMVFCFTRSACVETAKMLANWWATKEPRERYWSAPHKRITVRDKDLRDTISSGVAFHHAGLSNEDRTAIEKGYIAADINVICCTSTLAVGVNLPCHMVIIKNTVTYHNNIAGCKECSDLEIMQMLGRAGRPQFDDSAVAVIMTRTQLKSHYEKLVTGQEILESRLHDNLIDHLNAEIGLGTVTSVSSAKKWLSGTFLYVRLKENPEHYKLDAPGSNLDERLDYICRKGVESLQEHDLVTGSPKLRCTEFGDAMARYYLQFETMKEFLALSPKAKISEILSAISKAAEFKDVRFRAGEKNMYKNLNKNGSIKFPIPGDPTANKAHKVSLIIQSVLGAIELPAEEQKHQFEYNTAKGVIFQHVHRLVRCIIDCQLYLEDSVAIRNALMLARSLGAQVWDDSPLHMKQLEGVGIVTVRKLATAGITTIEDLETTEPHRIEQILSRNPPFGLQLRDRAKAFPTLRVSMKLVGEPVIKKSEHITVKIRAELGFLNEKVPETFQKRAVYVCLLAETSDGHKIHFARISAKKLNKGQDVLFSAYLTSASQCIRVYVMCDEIAGTMRYVVLKPEIPPAAFPPPKADGDATAATASPNTATSALTRRASNKTRKRSFDSGEFDDDSLNDADLAAVVPREAEGYVDIDDFDDDGERPKQPQKKKQKSQVTATNDDEPEAQQLLNGKWACKHACKDKTSCKHFCCREGLDKKPKPSKQNENKKGSEPKSDPKQTQLSMNAVKKAATIALGKPSDQTPISTSRRKPVDSKEARDLTRLHDGATTNKTIVPVLGRGRTDNKSGNSKSSTGQARLSFLENSSRNVDEVATSDYGMDTFDSNDLPEIEEIMGTQPASRMSPTRDMDDSNFDFGVFDDMNADIDFASLYDQTNADSNIGLVSTADEKDVDGATTWDLDEKMDDDSSSQLQKSNRRPALYSNDSTNRKHLFVGHSTSGDAPSETETHRDKVSDNAGKTQVHQSDTSEFFSPQGVPNHATQPIPGQPNESSRKTTNNSCPDFTMPENTFSADVGDLDEELGSGDSLEKWVKDMFGTKDFNYIG